MTDKLSIEKRSWNMSRIRSADTKPEKLLRSSLHRLGFRFRLHSSELPGHPDIVLKRYRTVILVQGCFWHQHSGCSEARRPRTNQKYWTAKLEGNVRRDRRNLSALRKLGWQVYRFWECQIEKDPILIAMRVAKELKRTSQVAVKSIIASPNELLRDAKNCAGHNVKHIGLLKTRRS